MEVKIEKAEKSEKSEKPEKSEKAEKGPRFVDVSYKINCISHIDSVTSTYYIDVKLFFHWIDPKFIGRKKNESVDIKTEGAWNPDIVVTNEHQLTSVDQHRDIKVNNSATGELKSSNQYRGTLFINNMDLATFPVDCQNLQICLKPYKLETEKLILRPRREESAIEQQDSHEWNVLGHFMKAFETDREASSTKKAYSTMYITVLVQRQSWWFVSNVFMLIGLLLAYDWFTFLISPDDTPSKLGITNTTLVASIAHKFVVGDELPKVPYRTLLDYYVDGCFALQFLVVASFFILAYKERHDLTPDVEHDKDIVIRRDEVQLDTWDLNWILLALNVTLYLLLTAWVLVKVYYVQTDVDHWLNMADHINAGFGDLPTVSVSELHAKTQPDHRWGVQFMHKKREKKSNFLHFDGKKAEELNTSTRRTPRAGDARASKSYQYSSIGQDSQGYQAMD